MKINRNQNKNLCFNFFKKQFLEKNISKKQKMSDDFASLLVEFLKNSFGFILPILLVSNCFFFLLYKLVNNICFIDFGWAVNHFLVGIFYYCFNASYNYIEGPIFFVFLFIWSFRLAYHLSKRICREFKDPRYEMVFANFSINRNILYFIQFELQAFLAVLTSCCLFFVFRENKIKDDFGEFFENWNYVLGLILVIMGIIGEAVSDYQLETFKNTLYGVVGEGTNNVKKVCEEGLWRYSRHPNLFFEFCIWFGFGLAGIRGPGDCLALISPVALFVVVNFLSVPITEKHMSKSRPYWSDYVNRTNKYFPFFKI